MTLAVLQVGLLVKDQLILEEASRAGAREAAVSNDDATVVQAVTDAAVTLDTERLSVAISREPGSGSSVTVTVTYDDTVVVPIVSWLFPSTIELSGEAVMRQEFG